MSSTQCLEVQDLTIAFSIEGKDVVVVDNVSFSIDQGEVVGLVGESGCGKSVTAMSLISLLPAPPSKRIGGSVKLNGVTLTDLSEKELQSIRGAEVGFIFQEPMSSLNPVLTIGHQLREALQLHKEISKKDADLKVIEILNLVGISTPELRVKQYSYELSGGLRQRIMIAMALICSPKLLIADEPTTALDVTIQAQILDLMSTLQEKLKMSILLITHDLGVVAENCSRVIVMYAGKIVESGSTNEVFASPRHPYTYALLNSSPRGGHQKNTHLPTIPGMVMAPSERGNGCSFAPRCPRALAKCTTDNPELDQSAHSVSCWNPQ
jgi:oligopeptide/dipeptide ABC transporter ATP-binding protein